MIREQNDFIIIRGERVLLRDPLPSDADSRIRWLTVETEWEKWDAPWERSTKISPGRIEEVRRAIIAGANSPQQIPREKLFIQLIDGPLLGWVVQYQHDVSARSVCIGIDICESGNWGHGLGTEALQLWINYLFQTMDLEWIGMSTWSGNERMVRVAQKCGFHEDERISGAREVRGKKYDLVRFSLLKNEWEQRCRTARHSL